MAARLLILLFPLVAAAQIEDIQIRLESNVKPPSPSVLCEVDGTYFHIPRSWLTKKKVITALNGMKLHLPWQAAECYGTDEWTTRSE